LYEKALFEYAGRHCTAGTDLDCFSIQRLCTHVPNERRQSHAEEVGRCRLFGRLKAAVELNLFFIQAEGHFLFLTTCFVALLFYLCPCKS